ncbi:sulfotransferase domain-containing protein [soil metagenome]
MPITGGAGLRNRGIGASVTTRGPRCEDKNHEIAFEPMQLPSTFTILTGLRIAASTASRILPETQSVEIERWMRGFEEAKRLPSADGVIASFGKSGRTWLRVLLSRYFAVKYGLPAGAIMEFDDFNRQNSAIPILLFTHDNYLEDYTGKGGKFDNYGRSKVVLLVRDPRDTAVSQYFQWKHRMKPRKKLINGYPTGDISVHDFITGEAAGIPKIIRFMNAWAADLERFSHLIVVRYEDLRVQTKPELARILAFLGQSPSDAALDDCVAYASVENMRQIERENSERGGANTRLKPGDASDPSSFKVRRAKVGGWRDYVTADEAEAIDLMVRETLVPSYGYSRA